MSLNSENEVSASDGLKGNKKKTDSPLAMLSKTK